MSENPIISVVVPMYNVEQYIERCIRSVLAQTYENFEIICVNDGCTDNTLQILATIEDPRIHVVHQSNKGLAAARNTGITAARGIYIALLDSDDYWASRKLERHLKHLHDNPHVGVSYSQSLFVNEQGKLLGIGQFPKLKNIRPQDILCRNPVGNGSAAVIRRRVLAEIAVVDLDQTRFNPSFFDPALRQSEDIECWLRIALNTQWKFEGIAEPLTYYRVNDGGLSANIQKQKNSWDEAMRKNLRGHEGFFKHWLPLAEAYQKRYLARRAVQSGAGLQALALIHQALVTDPRILVQEPSRTLVTYACCWLSTLPRQLFKVMQSSGMWFLGRYKIS